MTEAKVSVVIPAFNESETIADLVQRIHQRYPDFEIMVIDDGSADDTAGAGAPRLQKSTAIPFFSQSP